jgi:hypothetical protein
MADISATPMPSKREIFVGVCLEMANSRNCSRSRDAAICRDDPATQGWMRGVRSRSTGPPADWRPVAPAHDRRLRDRHALPVR